MDILKNRRDAAVTGKWTDRDLPMPEGMYPGDGGRPDRKGHGNATSDNNIDWDMRASSWQRGADTDYKSIDDEKREQDTRFGVPYADNLPAPSDPAGPRMCGARYQTASYDANDPLPNPHNFSSNPGFMSASTGDMATSGNPANGGTARVATAGAGEAMRTATIGNNRSGRSLRGGSSGGSGSVGIRPRQGTSGGAAAIPRPPGRTGTVGRTAVASSGNASLPAPGDVNPGQEGGPQVVTSGYSG